MKASDYIVSFISERGVDTVFGYIGGMITHLVDSLARSNDVKFVQTYHEQTAAIAAEGYAIENGKFGVSISTSGPGATNMMTGIADAYFDSIPVMNISMISLFVNKVFKRLILSASLSLSLNMQPSWMMRRIFDMNWRKPFI